MLCREKVQKPLKDLTGSLLLWLHGAPPARRSGLRRPRPPPVAGRSDGRPGRHAGGLCPQERVLWRVPGSQGCPRSPGRWSIPSSRSAQAAGAEAVATNCPLCQFNLDKQQAEMRKIYAGYQPIPIFYFSQLMGLALGLDASDYGWDRHYIDARPLLDRTRSLGALCVRLEKATTDGS